MILCTDRPVHPNDREALWVSMKAAYLNNERAVNPFPVRPVTKINLASPTRKARSKPEQPVSRPGAWKRGIEFIGNMIGGIFLFALALWALWL